MKWYKISTYMISAYMIGDMPKIKVIESDSGGWVEWKDVERIMIENKELKAKNKRLIQIINQEGIKEE